MTVQKILIILIMFYISILRIEQLLFVVFFYIKVGNALIYRNMVDLPKIWYISRLNYFGSFTRSKVVERSPLVADT